MRSTARTLLLTVALLAACSSSSTKSSPKPDASADRDAALDDSSLDADASDAASPDTAPPGCGTAAGSFPPQATELVWDDGKAQAHIREKSLVITANDQPFDLAEEPLYEAVRFDVAHPALVHGFVVQWTNIPEGAGDELEIAAGIYRDFGHNGFDFWVDDPLWEGTRCASDSEQGTWVSYVLPKPLEVEPGPIYVAHSAPTPEAPVFAFDGQAPASGKCDTYDACRSSVALPEAKLYFNGLSLPFGYNFLVRLMVEYTEQVSPAEQHFAAVETPASSSETPSRSGVSWGDFDNDGWDDLLTAEKLFRNNGGDLVDVTDSSGIGALQLPFKGGVWGDYDNDGCLDLFLYVNSKTVGDALLRNNCDGTFSDVTAAAKIVDQTENDCGDPANIHSPTVAAAWIDIDSDGFIDLYLTNYQCSATSFYADTVFHNEGDGTFTEWSKTHGFLPTTQASRGAAPADYDNDGFTDLYVNAYRLQPNWLFRNNADGTVSDAAAVAGAAGVPFRIGAVTYYGHTIGAAWGDLNNDGFLDLVAANLAHPRFFGFSDKTQLLINDGDGGFSDTCGNWAKPWSSCGLRYQETYSVPALADFDQDGKLDLVITAVYDGRPTDYYRGNGDGTFALDTYRSGLTTTDGWGVAVADIDHDGDLDLFDQQLFRNQIPPASQGHWLQVRVVGNFIANRAAIGASVRVETGSGAYLRHVQGGSGQGCQDSLYLHFGLGGATTASRVVVTFPGNKTVTFDGPFAVDQRLWLYEDGKHASGWVP